MCVCAPVRLCAYVHVCLCACAPVRLCACVVCVDVSVVWYVCVCVGVGVYV